MGANAASLWLRDERGEMATRIARNWNRNPSIKTNLRSVRTIVERVINGGELSSPQTAPKTRASGGQESIIAFNLRSILCVPLMVKSELSVDLHR